MSTDVIIFLKRFIIDGKSVERHIIFNPVDNVWELCDSISSPKHVYASSFSYTICGPWGVQLEDRKEESTGMFKLLFSETDIPTLEQQAMYAGTCYDNFSDTKLSSEELNEFFPIGSFDETLTLKVIENENQPNL